ncbi:MAG: alpha/beta family hydrolase [Pseudomonadota bacterium]
MNSSNHPDSNPPDFPAEQSTVHLAGPVGSLEALTDWPEEGSPVACSVICHSVSADGGTLHSKVVQMMERSMRELGAATVRLNFRGVGESEGEFDRGFGEAEDLVSVASWIRQVLPEAPLWLAGFGFGAYVTARAAPVLKPAQLVSVAPLIEEFDFEALELPPCPWLIVQGDQDECVNADAVYQWSQELPQPPQFIAIEDANHDFHRRLMDLRGVLKNGVRRQLSAEQDG